jgi:glycosyltransferase involved in cell wall biosynthesis
MSRAILFVVENDFFPQDTRVYRECTAVAAECPSYVLAPKARGQRYTEQIDGIRCYRYPAFHASSTPLIPLEYLLALFTLALLIPLIVFVKRVAVVHTANPPDFIIPAVAWLKLFGVKLIYDVHDVSEETLRGKFADAGLVFHLFAAPICWLERVSVSLSDLVIATNNSISRRVATLSPDKRIVVVRNSNPLVYKKLEDISKACTARLNVGYFGVLADDAAAGLDNIVSLAAALEGRGVDFTMMIVGDGPGLPSLRRLVEAASLSPRFRFEGFIGLPQAYDAIRNFDFGIVSWPDTAKCNLHTAMKIMDYMCCAVPVCSLRLTEQMYSTDGIGIHADSFEAMAKEMVDIYNDPSQYQALRRNSLERFNSALRWEIQETTLRAEYKRLMPCV